MLLVGILLAGAQPARPTDIWIQSNQSLTDLQACVMRKWSHVGRVNAIPMADGVALDYQMHSLFSPPGHELMTLEIHDDGQARRMTILYRHPWSLKNSWGMLRDTAKTCFADEWKAADPKRPSD